MIQFKNILVTVDSQHPSDAVLDAAVGLARTHQAQLTFIDVTSDTRWPLAWMTSGIEHAIEEISQSKVHALQKLAGKIVAQGLTVDTHVLRGRTSVATIRQALAGGHDLVIAQAKGPNSRREGFFGTTATRLLRKCPCPALLVAPSYSWASREVVAAVAPINLDSAHESLDDRILRHALAVCPADRPHPEVVSAWDMYLESAMKSHMREEEFEVLRAKLRAEAEHHLDNLLIKHKMGIGSPNVHFVHGDPGEAIIEYVADREKVLLVMGSIGRGGLAGLLLGNTAEQVLNRVQCSVLAVKPPGFVSPVKAEDAVAEVAPVSQVAVDG